MQVSSKMAKARRGGASASPSPPGRSPRPCASSSPERLISPERILGGAPSVVPFPTVTVTLATVTLGDVGAALGAAAVGDALVFDPAKKPEGADGSSVGSWMDGASSDGADERLPPLPEPRSPLYQAAGVFAGVMSPSPSGSNLSG